MIVIKQQHDQKPKRQRREDPFHIQLPEMDQPTSRLGRVKCLCDRHHGDSGFSEGPGKMRKTGPEESPYLQVG